MLVNYSTCLFSVRKNIQNVIDILINYFLMRMLLTIIFPRGERQHENEQPPVWYVNFFFHREICKVVPQDVNGKQDAWKSAFRFTSSKLCILRWIPEKISILKEVVVHTWFSKWLMGFFSQKVAIVTFKD